jgi:hypothetical protein
MTLLCKAMFYCPKYLLYIFISVVVVLCCVVLCCVVLCCVVLCCVVLCCVVLCCVVLCCVVLCCVALCCVPLYSIVFYLWFYFVLLLCSFSPGFNRSSNQRIVATSYWHHTMWQRFLRGRNGSKGKTRLKCKRLIAQ